MKYLFDIFKKSISGTCVNYNDINSNKLLELKDGDIISSDTEW